MTKTRIKRAIISALLCLVLSLGMFTPFLLPVSAAESVRSYDNSPIEIDMANMEEVEYPANTLGECSVVGFMEYCYSENTAYSSVYGLYIYVYNPTQQPINCKVDLNEIQMSDSFKEDGTKANCHDYTLTFLDRTDDHLFYKFKVTDSSEQYKIAKDYAALFNGKRRYEITALNITFEGSEKEKTFGISKIYEFTGYAAYCKDSSDPTSTLECKNYGSQDVHLEVFDTNYRAGSKGNNLYEDIQSVYFSLPNEYKAQWGNLDKITAEWYQYKTAPMFVMKDMEAYSALFDIRNKYVDKEGYISDESNVVTKTDYAVLWEPDYDAINLKIMYHCAFAGKALNYENNEFLSFSSEATFLTRLKWLFPITKEIESLDDYRVSSEEVKEYIKKYASAYPDGEKILDKYPADLFERYTGDGYKSDTFDIDNVESFIDSNKNQSLWESIWGINSTDDFPYSPITTISEGDFYLEKEFFCDKYLVNEEDYEKILDFAKKSYESNETPYLLRFAKTDYYSSPARFINVENASKELVDSYDGYVAQEHVFLNFDILSLEYVSEDGFTETVVGVVAESIDIINGLTAPENMPVEEEEWWQKIMMALGIIILIVALTFLGGPISFVLRIVYDGIKLIIKALLWLISIPFKIIGWIFRR